MKGNAEAMVWGAFVGDALALGGHWVYNTHVIDTKLGAADRLSAPLTSYHKGKGAGDLTHYGDQMLLLLEHAAAHPGFEPARFADAWGRFMATYGGYLDKASRATLENLAAGQAYPLCASLSDDLGGASRIAPLVFLLRGDAEGMAAAVRGQTAATHNHPGVVQAAELFGRAALHALGGCDPADALNRALADSAALAPLAGMVRQGMESAGEESRAAVARFGPMCALHAALPATVHLLARHGGDLRRALIANVRAGGDSAARGMLAGMVLGARHGMAAIPAEWREGLKTRERIAALLAGAAG
jgi:ADP-ribosylglycohydrolase